MLPTYASKDVKLSWNGVPIDGLAPDSFITASRNVDVTDEEVGADGQLSVSRMADKTGTVNVVLQQQSIGNHILAGVTARQEEGTDFVTGDLTVRDPSGTQLASFSGAFVKTTPEIDLGETATGKTRTWVFFVEDMKFNRDPAGSLISARVADYVGNQVDDILSRIGL